MNTAMAKLLNVLLDTNILVSAIVFGGKPQIILKMSLEHSFQVIISPILMAELLDVINKKFSLNLEDYHLLEQQILHNFIIVKPFKAFHILNDEDDNRVLEAAYEGKCDYIVTGDKELLRLGKFKRIKILTAEEFLKHYQSASN